MCQVRDLLFTYLDDQDTDELPLVPIAARVVLGANVVGDPSPTCPPFPLGTKVCKDFNDVPYEGSITEYRDTLTDGSPKYYHVVYTDGDEEDVDVKECEDMTRKYNDELRKAPRHINMCGLLSRIFVSTKPLAKENVFTRAEEMYGCDGPNVGHPFVGKYEIVQAVFTRRETHDGSHRYTFTIHDPDDDSISTSATLKDGCMVNQLQPGDSLRLEVMSASLRHAYLRVPSCIGFVDVSTSRVDKPVAVINVSVLGFIHPDTERDLLLWSSYIPCLVTFTSPP